MQVRILGPVDVVVDGVPRPVRGLRRKAVLAQLALRAGEIVSTDRLADVVWGERPPSANTVQTHVSALRRLLGDRAAIEARSPGYALGAATDVQEARRLIELGRLAPDPATSAARLREALALWRDRSLADVTELAALSEEAARLDLLRLDAVEALTEARLELGEHVQLVAELERLCREHPFREGLHRQLMLALYAAGRQAEALAVFEALRRSLDEQLGVGPSPALREAHAALLRQDAALPPPGPLTVEPNRFCTTGSAVRIAYHCAGSGPALVVPAAWIATLEVGWQDPHLRAFYATLAARHRVVRYDGPDTGLSGPWRGPSSLESEVDVLRTVVDELGLDRVALLGVSKGALVSLAFAALYPDRVDRLVLYGGYLDGALIATAEEREAFVALVRENWGMGSKLLVELLLPDEDAEARERFSRMQRASATAPVAARLLTGCYELRVTELVERVVAPVLVLHRRDDQLVPYSLGRELATRLPDARFVPLAGRSHFPHMGDARAVLDAIGSFLDLPLPNRSRAPSRE